MVTLNEELKGVLSNKGNPMEEPGEPMPSEEEQAELDKLARKAELLQYKLDNAGDKLTAAEKAEMQKAVEKVRFIIQQRNGNFNKIDEAGPKIPQETLAKEIKRAQEQERQKMLLKFGKPNPRRD